MCVHKSKFLKTNIFVLHVKASLINNYLDIPFFNTIILIINHESVSFPLFNQKLYMIILIADLSRSSI